MKKLGEPGTLFDKKGVPIRVGDLLKSYHFTGARKKRYWLYHVVLLKDGFLMGQSPTFFATGHRDHSCLHSLGAVTDGDGFLADTEVISGPGDKDCLGHEDRPKRRRCP